MLKDNMEYGTIAESYARDPKHAGFNAARYKFVSKMLTGERSVLEVGCGDCTFAPIVQQTVNRLVGIDLDISAAKASPYKPMKVYQHDMLLCPFGADWDAAFSLDVLEHIPVEKEDQFLHNIVRSLTSYGVFICGSPSLESQPYGSPHSLAQHVNCKTEKEWRETLQRHFRQVFVFGMNDETLHTGFGPMCHYRFAICTPPYIAINYRPGL